MSNALEEVLQSIANDDQSAMGTMLIDTPPPPTTPQSETIASTPISSWPSAPSSSTKQPLPPPLPQSNFTPSFNGTVSNSVLGLPPGVVVTPDIRSRTTKQRSIPRSSSSSSSSSKRVHISTRKETRTGPKIQHHQHHQERQRQEQQERQHQRIRSRQGGILEKTADHLARKKQWRKEATEPNGTFKPDISEYSKQLKREEPVHQRLFRVAKNNLEKKRERIIHDSKYDWESGEKLFTPKTSTKYKSTSTTTTATTAWREESPATTSSSSTTRRSGKSSTPSSIVAGNRLYRNALHSRAKLREKQIAELILQEQQRQQIRMSPQSRHFARKKVERELQTVFQRLNSAGTGLLTFEELSSGMASVHINMSSSVMEGGDSASLSMPDVLFWEQLTNTNTGTTTGLTGNNESVDLVTFLAITYQCLEETDPTWTPLQVCNRSLSTTEVIVAWCRAWMEALAVGGRTPYGHVQPSDGRHRWKQGSQSALGTDYNDFSGNAYRERKSKLAYESPDDRECTFKPKLTKRSRELDRKRVGTRGNANTNKSGTNSVPEYEARVALMLMLHQRKEDKLNVEREKQMLKTMEECTFTPAIQKSTRTLRMVRKSMDDSDRNRFSGDANRELPAFARLHDRHEEHRKKRYMELTSEQRELLDYCTFQPNLQLRQEEWEDEQNTTENITKGSLLNNVQGDTQGDTQGDAKIENDDDDVNQEDEMLASFGLPDMGRMPWENASSETKMEPMMTSTGSKQQSVSNVTVQEIKSQFRPFFAAGVHDHTARIRSARKKKQEKERELLLMGKSTQFASSLRMDHSMQLEMNDSNADTKKAKEKRPKGTVARVLAANARLLTTPNKTNGTNDMDEMLPESTLGGVSIPPALRMRVQAADGGSQTIEIYGGDSPAVVASKFANKHMLDSSKRLKLQQLIAAHMAKNNIPISNAI